MHGIRFVSALASTLLFASAVSAARPASAADVYQAFYVEHRSDSVVVHLLLDPDAPVQEVSFRSNECDFGPAEEVYPGEWAATGSSRLCSSATVTIVLEGAGGGTPSDQACGPFVGVEQVLLLRGRTDGYDAAAGSYSPETATASGHVCTNGQLRLGGGSEPREGNDAGHHHRIAHTGARIHGDAYTGDGTARTGRHATITGAVEALDAPLALEPVALPRASELANHTIPRSGKGRRVVRHDRFALTGRDTVALEPGTYRFRDFLLAGGATVAIQGPTEIYVERSFRVLGGSFANFNGDSPSDLRIYSTGRKVVLMGGAELRAQVHAPDAVIMRAARSDFFGTLAGRVLWLLGPGDLHGLAGGAVGSGEPPLELDLSWVVF